MRVKIRCHRNCKKTRWCKVLANSILNGKIVLENVPKEMRVFHRTYYIYALRYAHTPQAQNEILKLLKEDMPSIPPDVRPVFESLLHEYGEHITPLY